MYKEIYYCMMTKSTYILYYLWDRVQFIFNQLVSRSMFVVLALVETTNNILFTHSWSEILSNPNTGYIIIVYCQFATPYTEIGMYVRKL